VLGDAPAAGAPGSGGEVEIYLMKELLGTRHGEGWNVLE